ncbi:hypothetical protein [Capnocytophaga leadbetteri]|uniref:LIC11966 family surface protein n=1 Tax=Capnocytophaga leadbetteri TaxID=327575 RepID=UPI0028F09EA9|nr:hypothetical protein [Capnocytophaga leadbetteri]
MMNFLKNLQNMMGGSAEDMQKQMEQMQQQIDAAMGGNEKRGWQPDEGVYYAKGEYDNAVEYNNEIVCITNGCLDEMDEMNDAMDDNDFNRAEEVRLQWIEDIVAFKEEVHKLGAYKGDTLLLDAAIKFFDNYDVLMKDGYKTLIQMRLKGLRGTPEEQAQLKKNNAFIQKFTDKFNEASDVFIERYEDEDYDDEDE